LTKKTTPELISLYKQKELELLLNSNNRRHLIRSLELNGLINHPKRMRLNTLVVGITTEKEKLRERIRTRALAMIDAGIAREVAEIANTFGWDSEAMTASIYRIFKSVIQEQKPVAVALEEFVRSDMALAKRQMTWFKRNPNIVWSRDPEVLITKVEQFLAGQSLF
jgi:tRNA dimethylallyltransferase